MRVGLCCVHVLGSVGIMWALMDARYSLVLTGHDGGSMGLSGSQTGTWCVANGHFRPCGFVLNLCCVHVVFCWVLLGLGGTVGN